jgi:hypothetical protein
MIVNVKKDNVVIELYKKFNLLARKIVVLKITKDKIGFDDFITAELPQPTIIVESWDGYFIGWAIRGQIKTKAQKAFYKALALRLKKTFLVRVGNTIRVENSSLWALQYALDNGFRVVNNNAIYEMKTLAGACVSLTTEEEKRGKLDYDSSLKEELHIYAGTYNKSEDALFDFIRFKAYDYVRIQKQNNVDLTLDEIRNYCEVIAEIGYETIGGKGISTARAKARNIAEWTYNYYRTGKRPRKTKTKEELKMTRRERALTNAKAQYEKAHKKIMSAVTGMFADEYKKKDGSWNILKLAKELGMSKNTIKRHLRDENLI